MPLDNGAIFAGFAIVRRLGSGGMGDVYLARHPRLPRMQALRILPAQLSADAEFRVRFQREADLVASLSHPNIVGVHDRGECDGRLWILMGYIEGTDVARLMRERYPEGMPRAEAMQIVGDVAGALDYAHEHGLDHCNVKPGNILITDPGTAHSRILLADLGIARRIDDISGFTPAYVGYTAPEQLLDLPYQGRADQYSLAATAYHLLSGSAPFAHPSPVVVLSRHLSAPPPRIGDARPELADLDAALSRALAKDSGERFPRCHDLADTLRGEARSRPEIASGPVPLAPLMPAPAGAAPAPPAPTPPPTGPSGPYAQSWPSLSQHHPWMPPPLPPSGRRDRRWWLVGAAAVAMVAIIATVLVLTQGGSPSAKTPAVSSSPTAKDRWPSSDDTGPVGLVTADPTCSTWTSVNETFLATSAIEHWDSTHPGQLNPLKKPGSAWNDDERAVMQATAKAARVAAGKTTPLIADTPHRVMRELYEQFFVYGDAFANAIGDKYLPRDAGPGATQESVANALVSICTTIATGAANGRSPLVPAVDTPAPALGFHLQRFIATSDLPTCGEVTSVVAKYKNNPTVKDWESRDQLVSAGQWSAEQKALADAVTPLMVGVADDIQRAAQGAKNPGMLDFAVLSAQYQRAVVKALPTYAFNDGEIYGTARYLRDVLRDACSSVAS
jgi:serine/threonine protein kinase